MGICSEHYPCCWKSTVQKKMQQNDYLLFARRYITESKKLRNCLEKILWNPKSGWRLNLLSMPINFCEKKYQPKHKIYRNSCHKQTLKFDGHREQKIGRAHV